MQIPAFVTNHPVIFVLLLTLAWLVLLIIFMGIESSIFHAPYGDAMTVSISRLAVTACVLFLAWRLGWLEASGIARLGSWQVWLLSLGGLVYLTGASLYSFYGRIAFDFSSLIRAPDSRPMITSIFVAGLAEEILFRGLMLYALLRVWGNTTQGVFGSVVLTSALFALVHLTQIFTNRVPYSSTLVLVLQSLVISLWWGTLVVTGGSIWPAVVLHVVVNAIMAVLGQLTSMIAPEILAYKRLLWFSLPLGALAIGLMAQAAPHPVVPEIP